MFKLPFFPTVPLNRRNIRILRALSRLGESRFDQFLTPREWAEQVEQLGLTKTLIAPHDRVDDELRARAMHHLLERFYFEVFYTASEEPIALFYGPDDGRSEVRLAFRPAFETVKVK